MLEPPPLYHNSNQPSSTPPDVPDNDHNRNLNSFIEGEEDPPPYTPAPDFRQGETVLDSGPSRPFQQPVAQTPRPAPSATPQPRRSDGNPLRQLWTEIQGLTNDLQHITNEFRPRSSGVATNYTGHSTPSHGYSVPPRSSHGVPLLPPRHSSAQSPPPLPARRQSTSIPVATSDFAREFYAAGTGDGAVGTSNQERDETERSYAPPEGPPPNLNTPDASSSSSSIVRSHSTGGSHTPDDGAPTTTPVSGHPLLNDGKLLVYNKGYECDKCLNTGYIASNPCKPCKRCWSKYAKPFSGPLAYSYGAGVSARPDASNTTLQRPLLIPPRPPQSAPPQRLQKPLQPPTHMPGHWSHPPLPRTVSAFGPPPPGAVVYSAGDARLGGQLCWCCNGKGNINLLLLNVTCEVCGGMGRIYH